MPAYFGGGWGLNSTASCGAEQNRAQANGRNRPCVLQGVGSPRKLSLRLLPVAVALAVTALIGLLFFTFVDLKPRVEENFFFSTQDPQVRADREILRTFPASPEIVLAAAGDIESPTYVERVRGMSAELSAVPGVTGVQSLTNGPKDVDEAFKSALWTRVLVADNRKSTYLFVTPGPHASIEAIARRVEAIQRRFDRPGSKREREFQKLRAHLMKELAGRKTHGKLRLRPEGLVALEWARLGED